MNNSQDNQLALQPVETMELGPAHPQVVAVARRLRWTAEKALQRIQECLPTRVEQNLYMTLALQFGVRPRTFALMLHTWTGNQHLTEDSLIARRDGPNLAGSRFSDVADYLECVLSLTDRVATKLDGYPLGAKTASELVLAYGDQADKIIASLYAHAAAFKQRLGIKTCNDQKAMAMIIRFFAQIVLPHLRSRGRVDPADAIEFLEDDWDPAALFARGRGGLTWA